MSGPQFFETRMGMRFYEVTVPKLAQALERIADNLGNPIHASIATTGGLEVGSAVVIRSNPHHPSAVNVTGTVVGLREGAGFAGCDLVDVEYQDALEGRLHIRPFAAEHLAPGEPKALLGMAEWHEVQAAELRRQAGGGHD